MTVDGAMKIIEENQEIREFMVLAMKALERCKTKEERQRLTRQIINTIETGGAGD